MILEKSFWETSFDVFKKKNKKKKRTVLPFHLLKAIPSNVLENNFLFRVCFISFPSLSGKRKCFIGYFCFSPCFHYFCQKSWEFTFRLNAWNIPWRICILGPLGKRPCKLVLRNKTSCYSRPLNTQLFRSFTVLEAARGSGGCVGVQL